MNAFTVTGLGFGDEAKGKSTDYLSLVHQAEWNIRHNGGSQAYHNVHRHGGKHHAFRQIGSGSFNEFVKTMLGPEMLIDPLSLDLEAKDFDTKTGGKVLNRVYASADALVITPFHMAVNRLREMSRSGGRHGSVGKGIGEVRRIEESPDVHVKQPRMKHLLNKDLLSNYLMDLQDYLGKEAEPLIAGLDKTPEVVEEINRLNWDIETLAEMLHDVYSRIHVKSTQDLKYGIECSENVVFEGAQGVLLDEKYGFYPHNTWSNTTHEWARYLLPSSAKVRHYGVIRTLTTRHGAGPFPTEDPLLGDIFRDEGNPDNEFQGAMRYGHLDLALLRYALKCNPVDVLIVNHWDQLEELHEKLPTGLLVNLWYRQPGTTDGWNPTPLWSVPAEVQQKQTDLMFTAETSYMYLNPDQYKHVIEAAAGVPVVLQGIGPKSMEMRHSS